MTTFSRSIFAALAVLVPVIVGGVTPAGAQSAGAPTDAAADGDFVLIEQSPFVAADGEFIVRVALGSFAPTELSDAVDEADGTEQPSVFDLVVTIFGRIDDATVLDDEPEVAINRTDTVSLTSFPIDGNGVVTIRMPVRAGPPFDDVDRIRLPDQGVYPIIVELREGPEVRGSIRTNLIRLASDPADAADPADATGGSDDGAPDDGGEPVGTGRVGPPVALVVPVVNPTGVTLEDAIAILEAHPDVAMTTVLDGDAVARLQGDQDTLAAFRQALGARHAVTIVQPSLDPSALAAIGRLDRFRDAVAAGADSVADLGLTPDRTIATTTARPTTPGATELADLGLTTVLDIRSLAGEQQPRTAAYVRTSNGIVSVASVDRISDLLTDDDRTIADRVQRSLAALALSDGATPIVIAPLETSASGSLSALVSALTSGPVEILPLPAAAALAAAERDGVAPRPLVPLGEVEDLAAETVALLATHEGFHIDGSQPTSVFHSRLDRMLASDWESDRAAAVRSLNDELRSSLDVIALPDDESFTLAARTADIPLTIENRSDGVRNVMLSFRSNKIEVAEQGAVISVGPGTSSIDVELTARSLGTSPLQVSVLTPDGEHVLATTQFRVRSTAVPGVGLLISAIGLVLLGVWWYLSIRRGRRSPAEREPVSGREPPRATDHDSVVDREDAVLSGSVLL